MKYIKSLGVALGLLAALTTLLWLCSLAPIVMFTLFVFGIVWAVVHSIMYDKDKGDF